jgi:pimeloyl-ACP methyl ester carboxylesterase
VTIGPVKSSVDLPEYVSSTDEVTLKLYDLGGDGPPLLFAHATGFCGPMWGPMAETMSRQYRCIAFDFRAHGASTRPVGRDLVWDGMADDLLAVVDAIRSAYGSDDPIPAVGHSMGGATPVLAEARQPGTWSKVWAFEPILFGHPHQAPVGEPKAVPNPMSEIARNRRPTFPSRADAQQRWGSRPPLSALDPRALQAYVDHGLVDVAAPSDPGNPHESTVTESAVTLACRPEDEASVFEYHEAGAVAALAGFGVPYAAVVGEPSLPVDAIRAAADVHHHLEVVEMPHLTHFGPFAAPDDVAQACVDWLATR